MSISKEQIIYEKLEPYAKENLQMLDVKAGSYMGNKMCHHNARQILEEQDSKEFNVNNRIAFVLMFIPKSGVRIHVLNKDIENKHNDCAYVDNTLGHLSKFNYYYLIKEYSIEDLRDLDTHRSSMYDLLTKHKKEILEKVFHPQELSDLNITQENI